MLTSSKQFEQVLLGDLLSFRIMQPPAARTARELAATDIAVVMLLRWMNNIREFCARIIYVLEHRCEPSTYSATLVPALESVVLHMDTYEIAIDGSTDGTIEETLRSIAFNSRASAEIWRDFWERLARAAEPTVALRFEIGVIIAQMIERCARSMH